MVVQDELRILVEAETARAIENFKKLSGGIEESEKKSASLGDALDSLSKKSLIISGIFGGAGIAAIKFAGENQQLQLSLKNMLGSAEEASLVFEQWRQLGNSPGLSSDEVFSLGKALVNMGNDTQYATQTIQMLGNVAAGTGVSFGEISSSFERARAMGNLTTRDLVRLQQQGIPIVKQLSVSMGVCEESISRMAAEGKIGFNDLESAFKSMTGPGGQFAGMMNELSGTVLEKFSTATSDAKQALASFGELLLPIAADILNGASSLLNGITNMDEGTKRFVLGMGGVVAVSGPAIIAIKGIAAAMALVAANPFMLAIGGAIAAAGIITGLIYKQVNAYDDLQREIAKTNTAATDLLKTYADGNEEKTLDEKTTRELIRLYPELTNVIRANNTTVREAAQLQRELYVQNVVNAQSSRIRNFQQDQEALRNIIRELNILETDIRHTSVGNGLDSLNATLEQYIGYRDSLMERIFKQQDEINETLSSVGKQLNLSGAIIDIPVRATIDTTSIETIPPRLENVRKTWQEWFGEIANIDHTLIENSGNRAAQLYINEFERSLTARSTIADVLGSQLDIAGVLRNRQTDVHNALVELFSIDPAQINRPFTLMRPEIQKLVEEYQRLGEEAKKAEFNITIEELTRKIDNLGKSERQLALDAELARLGLNALSDEAVVLAENMDKLTVANALSNLRTEVQNLGKDQYDLMLATLEAAGALEEERAEALELVETLRAARNMTHELHDASISFYEYFSKNIASGLMNIFPELEEKAAESIANISAQLSMMSFDGLLNGLSAVGEAFAKGENAAESLKGAMADMALQILNQLPSMFLQAGLQLIAQGQWAIGLGFIAAAGSSAMISGYTKGAMNKESGAVRNAHGNAFDTNGIVPFAHGGSFTNQIVNTPTFFRFGGKFGVMGEAGPESIIPLRRMSNGDLGVASTGGSANVIVNIINNSGVDARQEEQNDADGNRQVDVIIGQAVNNHISSGKADRAMSRYGVRPVGV